MNSQQLAGPNTPPRDGPEPGNLVARAEALGISSEDQRLNTVDSSSSGLDKPSVIQQTIPPSGQVVIGGKETQYVGATHWAAILDDIGEVKEYFDQGEDDDIEEETGPEPSLLFNTDAPPTKAKLLAALPSRRVVDKIVQGYFHGANPSLHILHAPTFQKEYLKFWANPHDIPICWLGLLYGIMCLSLFSSYAAGEENPDEHASQMQTIRTYRRNCIQCIRLSDYTKPGKYTIEAMLAHLEGEFVLSDADQVNCYVLLGVAVRLALRMGLHRDPDRVGGQITPFQGEMRRRLWAILRQIDLLASFHIGLPSMVESVDSDVQLPRNLNDSDFDEDCTELPPLDLTRNICEFIIPPSYDDIMELDAQLDVVQANVPPSFRFQPIDSCIADPAKLIIQRLNIAHLLCKSRCVLHRKYLVGNQDHPEREYSVKVGIDAAMQLLNFQKQTYEATRPGGS
ncbi:putative c6 transcription protein [Botrytis fragariae]|uniref:Putative c6 transcription protein n=1 Tax=Botrytis fragariae TaxID=1964551 RepID=A0A8H6AP28_9HELO|nr:putative c6 transcription protein [Botrytis fragariae]KAF5870883.1 putative c6 transcription protein [Botrytis fragariae]